MQIWVVSVVVLFMGIQAYQWLSHLALPLPIYGVAGVLLAIASNRTGFRLPTPPAPSLTPPPETPSSIPSPPDPTPPKPSISFKISRD